MAMLKPRVITLPQVYRKVKYFLVPYLVLLAACLTIKLIFTREEIYFAVNTRYTPWGDIIFPFFTALGDGLTVIVLALLLALCNYRWSFLLITSYGITALVAQILKRIFDMPRPSLYFKDYTGTIHYIKGIYMLTYHSFPSGHTVTAFSACIAIAYLFKNRLLNVAALLMAIAIGFSRMYLSQHFFEDVVAGSAIGVFFTLFWLYWLDNLPFLNQPKWHRGLLVKREM